MEKILKNEINECDKDKEESENLVKEYCETLVLNKKHEQILMNNFKNISNKTTDRIEEMKQKMLKLIK